MKPCFLDTCTVLDLMRGRPQALAAVSAFDDLLVAFVILGELAQGAYGSRDPARELARIEPWLSRVQIVAADSRTAYLYGEALADLERRGQRIPTNDVWAAAVACQLDFPLVSRDEHFGRVMGLRWIKY